VYEAVIAEPIDPGDNASDSQATISLPSNVKQTNIPPFGERISPHAPENRLSYRRSGARACGWRRGGLSVLQLYGGESLDGVNPDDSSQQIPLDQHAGGS